MITYKEGVRYCRKTGAPKTNILTPQPTLVCDFCGRAITQRQNPAFYRPDSNGHASYTGKWGEMGLVSRRQPVFHFCRDHRCDIAAVRAAFHPESPGLGDLFLLSRLRLYGALFEGSPPRFTPADFGFGPGQHSHKVRADHDLDVPPHWYE